MTSTPDVQTGISRPNQIRTSRIESLLPDASRSGAMFGRFGYSLSEAVADLIDNSLDAKASEISIRVVRSDERILRIMIIDNGKGMNTEELAEGMRFGSQSDKSGKALGKYGFGLKTASLSQSAMTLVLSKKNNIAIGRRWTRENIGKGWRSEILNESDVASYLKQKTILPRSSGTVVIWEELDHFRANSATIGGVLKNMRKSLSTDLGLWFHRFIASSRLAIAIEEQTGTAPPTAMVVSIKPLDPFSYPAATRLPGYPKLFDVEIGSTGNLRLECHIWPPKSEDEGYRLGSGKVAARQGFYFYRNDRLIQAGGWHGCRDNDIEPHLSLARVQVNLTADWDDAFNLKVTKSAVVPPTEFATAVKDAANRGGSFKDYIADAQAAYRRKKKQDGALFPYVPGKGLAIKARAAAKKVLWEKGTGRPGNISFDWKRLEPYEFFRLDPDRSRILLNSDYRGRVLGSNRASPTDAPIVKLLLFFLLQEEFDRKANSSQYREWLKRVNEAIVLTLGNRN